jgi:hypothetical protein
MQKWEYLIVKANIERDYLLLSYGRRDKVQDYMDAQGTVGWELVAVVPTAETDDFCRLYFKRPVEEKQEG